jgi:predicted nuclease of predicted toxin-antitoxin system
MASTSTTPLLIDECVDMTLLPDLVELGWTNIITSAQFSGSSDNGVLELARRNQAVLLTFDADFGRLIFHDLLPAPVGVIYVWLESSPRDVRVARLAQALPVALSQCLDRYVKIDLKQIRVRSFPDSN